MKVILLQDVAKIGRKSDLVVVPDGYALNKLIPMKMAEPATANNKKRIDKLHAEVELSKLADESHFTLALKALTETKLKIEADVNEKGHTFKAVNAQDVALAGKAIGVKIDSNMISFEAPIKEIGEHEVELVLGEKRGKFKIEVIKK
ncbi:50S ribosomal protein L9 [Candidatus Kaiserbacteria bacterium]|nr:50S ribosomal protein L9 [Candidatus Kaiserbacteria bacterium]USN92141.1 MAG: 50S ribosomal protein L9 [Candidatus Nomurabacteria bacterium]